MAEPILLISIVLVKKGYFEWPKSGQRYLKFIKNLKKKLCIKSVTSEI